MTPSSSRAASYATRVIAQGKYETLAMLKNGEQLMLNIALPLFALIGLRYTGFLDSYAEQFGVSRIEVAVPGGLSSLRYFYGTLGSRHSHRL